MGLSIHYRDQKLELGINSDTPCLFIKQSGSIENTNYLSSVYLPKLKSTIAKQASNLDTNLKGVVTDFADVDKVYPEFASDFMELIIPEIRKLGIKYNVAIMTKNEYGSSLSKQINRQAFMKGIISMSLMDNERAFDWLSKL
ncbi:MAG TPA: hypothetical protein DCE41_33420 [Cytophagales bacterium]|nr:hypothetical protein [Cytophagales bacterium]HAA18956.1 hypothetical protein [Cytophagales bacterium]HAP64792.1 hypothetical protein [Cytophagales bacterium]